MLKENYNDNLVNHHINLKLLWSKQSAPPNLLLDSLYLYDIGMEEPANRVAVFLVIRSILTANASQSFFRKLPNFAKTFASITDRHALNVLFPNVLK